MAVVSFDRRLSATAVTYDRAGRVVRNWLPYFTNAGRVYWNELFYDGLGRVTEERKASGQTTRTAYSGLLTTVTNTLGQVTRSRRNGRDELVRMEDAAGTLTDYRYDPVGNLVETIVCATP